MNFLKGVVFGEAVKKARREVYKNHPKTNTWGAYQCYGDPFYKLNLGRITNNGQTYSLEQSELELYNLCYQLESKGVSQEAAKKKLREIDDWLKQANLSSNKILEYKADVYAKLGDYANSKKAFEQLFKIETSTFTFKSIEQYCNIVGKFLVERIQNQKPGESEMEELVSTIDDVIQKIQGLIAIGKTSERYSLLGSAYKRKLMLLRQKDKSQISDTLLLSSIAYFEAAKIKNLGDSYAINNCVQLGRIYELISGEEIYFPEEKAKLNLTKLLTKFKQSSTSKEESKKNFWDYAAEPNLMLSTLMINPSAAKVEKVRESYHDLWKIAGSPSNQKSELEHLDVLIKSLALAESEEGKTLKDSLKRLKDEIG